MRYLGFFPIGVLVSVGFAGVAAADEAEPVSEMVVTASPWASPLDQIAAPVTIVGRDKIRRSGSATLGDLLANEPGIAQSSFAEGASRPIIRGLDNTRVHVLENGLGGDGVSAVSEDHAVPIDPLSATGVEVVRGPATLRYGSQAIGGVVNVLNSRIPPARPVGGFSGEALASYDTVNDGRQGSVIGEAATGRLVWHADAYRRETDDYRIPGSPSRQDGTWTDSKGVAGGVSAMFDAGYAGISMSHFDADYGIPAPGDPSDPTFIDMQQTKIQTAAEFDDLGSWLGPWFGTLRLTGGYNRYNHGEVGSVSDNVGSRFDDRLWEGRAELQHGSVGPFTGVVGVHAIRHELSAGGEGGELLAPSDRDMVAAFVFERMPLTPALKLELAARVEHVAVEGGALDQATLAVDRVERSFTPFGASAGLAWSLGDDWGAGATAQVAQRAPEATELFSRGPHEATGTFELGDRTLGKETAVSAELSLRREGRDFSFEAAAYLTKFDGYILKALTGETCDDSFDTCTNVPGGAGTELAQVRFDRRNATFRGVEIGGRHSIAELGEGTVGLDGQFDFVRATLGGGGNVPRIPPMRAGAGLYYEAEALAARIGFLYAFAQDELGTGETKTGGYTLIKAEFRYFPPRSVTRGLPVELALIGDNLLNDDVRNHVSFKKSEVLLPGRAVRFVASAQF